MNQFNPRLSQGAKVLSFPSGAKVQKTKAASWIRLGIRFGLVLLAAASGNVAATVAVLLVVLCAGYFVDGEQDPRELALVRGDKMSQQNQRVFRILPP